MTALALALLLHAEPQIVANRCALGIALVPLAAPLQQQPVRQGLDRWAEKKKGRFIKADVMKRASYPGLDNEALQYTAQQLSDDELKKVAKADQVVTLFIGWPPDDTKALEEAYAALALIGEKHQAVIYDENAATALTASAWKARHLTKGMSGGVADVPMHVQVHMVVQPGGLVMLDTGGMPRFGIEDFELLDVNRSSVDAAGNLVNLVAQRLVEGARPDARGRLLLKFEDLKNERMRTELTAKAFKNRGASLAVAFTKADEQRGAREGALELTFPDCSGKDRGERLDCALKSLFGSKDATNTFDSEDPRVTAAKAKAMTALKKYEPKVKKGLPEGEILLVKARFAYDDGNEWMWVDVHGWQGNVLTGRLENEPYYVKNVKAGQTVDVKLTDVMDYMYKLRDDSFFGNETGRVLHPEMFEDAGGGRIRVKP